MPLLTLKLMITACALQSDSRNMIIRDLKGILNRFADLWHFLTLVDFFKNRIFRYFSTKQASAGY